MIHLHKRKRVKKLKGWEPLFLKVKKRLSCWKSSHALSHTNCRWCQRDHALLQTCGIKLCEGLMCLQVGLTSSLTDWDCCCKYDVKLAQTDEEVLPENPVYQVPGLQTLLHPETIIHINQNPFWKWLIDWFLFFMCVDLCQSTLLVCMPLRIDFKNFAHWL